MGVLFPLRRLLITLRLLKNLRLKHLTLVILGVDRGLHQFLGAELVVWQLWSVDLHVEVATVVGLDEAAVLRVRRQLRIVLLRRSRYR